MMNLEQKLIQNLERKNALLEKQYANLEQTITVKDTIIIKQNQLIHELQEFCDKQQQLLDDISKND